MFVAENIIVLKMKSCEEAMFYYTVCGLKRLDDDGDGISCEILCGHY